MGLFDRLRKAKAPAIDSSVADPMGRLGSRDINAAQGFLWSRETSAELNGTRKYTTYANMVANVSVVALAVRYMLNILGGTSWKFQASEADRDGKYAAFMDSVLVDMRTPWHRHVKKMGMYRFNGASLHEWIAAKRTDGLIGLADIEHRPMASISRWNMSEDGFVGVTQRTSTGSEVMIPRGKLIYLVDDGITDSPEGVGLLRHVAETSRQLQRLEQLEGYGYEMDVNGVPVVRLPYAALDKQYAHADEKGKAAITKMIEGYEKWASNHIKNPAQGLVMDSAPYFGDDAARSPSGVMQFGLEMLSSNNSSAIPMNASIERKSREAARILGIESLMLGTGGAAQASVSKDKTSQLQTTMNQVNSDMASTVNADMVSTIWAMNGLPLEMRPTAKPDTVRLRDIEAMIQAIISLAGAPFREGDTAENEMRDMLGVSRAPEILAGSSNLDDSIDIDMGGL